VLLDEQRETPFDLRFRIFRVPVRVHPFFWLVSVFMGFDLIKIGIEVLLVWVLCVFVSILLHELGHVWMGQFFGSRGHIVLQGLCGLAVGASSVHGRWRRIAVYLAGPGIQFLFFALLFAGLYYLGRPLPIPEEVWQELDLEQLFHIRMMTLSSQPGWPKLAQYAVQFLLSINIWWPIINLLPVWPLDGGQVSRELFVWRSPIYGARNSLALSLVTAIVVAVNALSAEMGGPRIPYMPVGGRFFIAFFAMFAIESFMLLQVENARTRSGWRDPDDDRLPWERDPDEWKRG
jgi:stage IV sporulation protein FB